MSTHPVTAFAQVLLATLAATVVLARVAPFLGWTDGAEGPDAARKLQRRAVPAVGGAALLVGLALAPAGILRGTSMPWGAAAPAPLALALGLGALFALGLLDDVLAGGLRPGAKLLGQVLGLLPPALSFAASAAGGARSVALGALFVLAGLIALNALNAFDNADGGLTLLAATGFALAQPSISAACLGFLPANLDAGRPSRRASAAPTAYLGDAGSHLLGFLVLVTPGAWGTLWLPALDVARLSIARTRAGSRPWIGDRAHFAHRLAARGLSRAGVALVQALVAAPACLGVGRSVQQASALPALLGLVASTVLFGLVLYWTRGLARPGAPGNPSAARAELAAGGASSNNVALDPRRAP